MCGEAVASLHISPKEFWDSRPIDIYYALNSFSNNKIDSIKESWEQMRMQTFYLINIQLDKKQKLDYKQFKHKYMPFAWDIDKQTEEKSIEELDVIFEMSKKMI